MRLVLLLLVEVCFFLRVLLLTVPLDSYFWFLEMLSRSLLATKMWYSVCFDCKEQLKLELVDIHGLFLCGCVLQIT